MKTPEEIKRGLAHCANDNCDGCPYVGDCMTGTETLEVDALEYICNLEIRLEKLKSLNGWKSVEEEPTKDGMYYVLFDWSVDVIQFERKKPKGERWGCYRVGKGCNTTEWAPLKPSYWIDAPKTGDDEQ